MPCMNIKQLQKPSPKQSKRGPNTELVGTFLQFQYLWMTDRPFSSIRWRHSIATLPSTCGSKVTVPLWIVSTRRLSAICLRPSGERWRNWRDKQRGRKKKRRTSRQTREVSRKVIPNFRVTFQLSTEHLLYGKACLVYSYEFKIGCHKVRQKI